MNILKLNNITMKSRATILVIVFCTFIMSCSNKHKRFQPNATNDNIVAINTSADTFYKKSGSTESLQTQKELRTRQDNGNRHRRPDHLRKHRWHCPG